MVDRIEVMKYYYDDGSLENEQWYKGTDVHREGKPAEFWYFKNGDVKREYWVIDHQYHRLDGPAIIFYNEEGEITYQVWCVYGKTVEYPPVVWPVNREKQIELKMKYG